MPPRPRPAAPGCAADLAVPPRETRPRPYRLRVPVTRPRPRVRAGLAAAGLALVLGGCTIPVRGAEPAPSSGPTTTTGAGTIRPVETGPAVVPTPAAPAPPSPTAPSPSADLVGRTVFLDPGHNASGEGNEVQVPTGRGGTKDCQTSGTATDAGYPEHTFTFDVAARVRDALVARGARVELSRPDDAGAGPCVDQRAADANASGAQAVLSIHGDGADSSGRGFHVAYSDPPLNPVQAGDSVALARTVRDALVRDGLTPSTYRGEDGLDPRADLAGLNLSERPSVLVECGNMRNAEEAAAMTSEAGRQRYADALTDALVQHLTR